MQENKGIVPQQQENQEPITSQQESDKQVEFFKTYASQIITGILIVAAIGIAVYRYYDSSVDAKQEAANKLFSAKNTQELELLVNKNSSTAVAPLALLKLAKMHFNSANYDMALSKYNEFKTKYPQHEMVDVAEMGRLHCLEARNQIDDALAGFTTFTSTKTNHFLYAEAVIGRARCLEQSGRHKEAIAVYEDFIAAYPKSTWTSKVEDLITTLKRKLDDKKKTSG
ncbi:MAG: tetratricopeptide repeat protein [Kiritimatiellae bacterium]|nr:tetratricopeptide repeat protein [Kiritimatiellia bacterium]MDD5520005.1 tetratricopeptide repeat protein [Kiritimatiellia bacterium]